MYLYLHGFASSGNASKSQILRKYAGEQNVISPTLSVSPAKAIKQVDELISTNEIKYIFGSSLGGFYALYFCGKYNLPVILINPAIEAHIGMQVYTGMNTNYKTNEQFDFKKSYIDELKSIYDSIIKNKFYTRNIILLLAEDDTLLPYKNTLKFFNQGYEKLYLEKNSQHEFNTFENILPEVLSFLKSNYE